MSKPYRVKIYEDTGKPIHELIDEDINELAKKTSKYFKEKML